MMVIQSMIRRIVIDDFSGACRRRQGYILWGDVSFPGRFDRLSRCIVLLLLLCFGSMSVISSAGSSDIEAFIDLGGHLPATCREPSRMPDSVEDADTYLGCRQMKLVQHMLNGLIDERTHRVAPGDEPVPPETSADGERRQRFFGRYWSTITVIDCLNCTLPICSDDHPPESDTARIDHFEDVLRNAFPRMMAVLIASLHPSARSDGEPIDEGGGGFEIGDDWLWELPSAYVEDLDVPGEVVAEGYEAVLEFRARVMRDDVNAWIQQCGLWVTADAGSERGDFDFVLLEIIQFMYIFKDHPELLYDESIWTLLSKNWCAQKRYFDAMPAWQDAAIPFSGPDVDRELWYHSEVPITGKDYFSETENHVLMTLAHYYLVNQWIYEGYRGLPRVGEEEDCGATCEVVAICGEDCEVGEIDYENLAPCDAAEPREWFAYQDEEDAHDLSDTMRDVLARPMFKGMFEDNARPYGVFSFRAFTALASFAEDVTIRTEAQNALHFLSTKYALQSLEGRRFTPMRRNCNAAADLGLYRDGAGIGLAVLSGAYKWNDSPYGLKRSLEDAGACFGSAPDCYWDQYTWKVDCGGAGFPCETGRPCDGELPCFNTGSGRLEATPDDAVAEQIAHEDDPDQLANDYPDLGVLSHPLFIAFSNYRIPRAIHDFMIHKYDGYYARMMPQYDTHSYTIWPTPEEAKAKYFSGDQVIDNDDIHNERTPEFYFAGHGFLNIAGGMYNNYWIGVTDLGQERKDFEIPEDPFPPFSTQCRVTCEDESENHSIEGYDYLSKPYTILPTVSTACKGELVDGACDSSDVRYYKPFGTTSIFPFGRAREHLPFMRGSSSRWYKSANVATYKNFSYGYRIQETGGFGLYDNNLNGEFPMDLPQAWEDVPSESFEFGKKYFNHAKAARFKIYDLREYMRERGQTGYILITARVRKFNTAGQRWTTSVARGFWEVVPGHDTRFPTLAKVRAAIEANNDPEWFRLGHDLKDHKHFRYKLTTSGETVHLSQYYGDVFEDDLIRNEGAVQGIIGLQDENGNGYSGGLGDVFLRFMNNKAMNKLPLIASRTVNGDYTFEQDENDNHVFNVCARDGWLAVNNPRDGSYLFADSRRGLGFEDDPALPTPYWMDGLFENDDPWCVSCGLGGSGEWIPAPPDNGMPDECSNPEICPEAYLPDLKPSMWCRGGDVYGNPQRLLFRVKNIGNGAADPSIVSIGFEDVICGGQEACRFNVPALESGGYVLAEIPIPNGCRDDFHCAIVINADVDNVIEEIDELNNGLHKVCQP